MKIILAALCTLFVVTLKAQTLSSITPLSNPETGKYVKYLYKPHAGLVLGKISVSLIYEKSTELNVVIPLAKTNEGYTFSFAAQDSVRALLACIVDSNKNVVDNNGGKAFMLLMADKTGKQYPDAGINAAWLLSEFGSYTFKITPPKGYVPGLFTTAFAKNPSLKKDNYIPYLLSLNKEDKTAATPLIIAYAHKLATGNPTEADLNNAYYTLLQTGLRDNAQNMQAIVVKHYPKGDIAKKVFMKKVYGLQEPSEEKYIDLMQEYIGSFDDSSAATKDIFYTRIISNAGDKKDWATLNKYDAIIGDRINVVGVYNNLAWGLSGENVYNEGKDLDVAASLSQRALQFVGNRMATARAEEKGGWKSAYDTYADTYALILYKQGKIDSAYYYEDGIDKTNFYDGGRELLAACIEKLKGPEAARLYIEEQLTTVSNSAVLQKQLAGIYKQLNLPEENLSKIREKSAAKAKEKAIKEIVALLGSTKAKDFSLKDLNGNTVTLSSLRDKVVVLDFWATWCGPCRASFPAMQENVAKYKDDKDVVFLFLDVWENGDEVTVSKNTAKFIADNKYTFHVLMDYNSKVPPVYKVDAIPTKFVIDRKGNIVFMGHDLTDMPSVIEGAKNS